jgi:hypothetical protein
MDEAIAIRLFDVRVSGSGAATVLVKGTEAFQLSTVGSYIWTMCDGEHTVGEIADGVHRMFAVDHQVAVTDTHEFVHQLGEAKLVELIPAPR